ncbi:trace amine-associated receptor 1-like [Scleropages formosus]|uniref:trace amine-associated receptor 1-like n=1 Tax=Scleropages formosus TaxID=113540 RepID=UPI0010FAA17A|nr:trace amine-associated receptor 1-like [Scleropages formosus]
MVLSKRSPLMMNYSHPGTSQHLHFCYESSKKSCPRYIYSLAVRVPLYIFFAAAILLTVFGNLLVIIAIVHFKQLHTPTNYLVLSLAITDFLLGAIIMPPSMVRSMETCWYLGNLFCKFYNSTAVTLCTASIVNLSFISIDRHYAVCQPLQYQTKITNCVTLVMILIGWSLSVLTGFGMIFLELNIWGIEDFYYENIECVGGCFLFQSFTSSFISSTISFYIPGFIMIGIYRKIFLIARKQARSIHNSDFQNGNLERMKTYQTKIERKSTKTLAIVMGVFLSCWSPFFLCNIIDPVINYSLPPFLLDALAWVGFLNSAFNPLIYAFFYSWFRKAFTMIIFCKIYNPNSSRTNLFTN